MFVCHSRPRRVHDTKDGTSVPPPAKQCDEPKQANETAAVSSASPSPLPADPRSRITFAIAWPSPSSSRLDSLSGGRPHSEPVSDLGPPEAALPRSLGIHT